MADPARRIGDLLADLFVSRSLRFGDALPRRSPPRLWSRDGMAGRLVEIWDADASASLTAALGLVLDAQRSGETPVWVTSPESCFFPPDAAESGVDLDALAVVRVPRDRLLQAASMLVRSGAFGLVVVDGNSGVGQGALARLLGLAREHDTAVVFLSGRRRSASSLGSLVSLRAEARRVRLGADRHRVELCVLKDKRRAPGWRDAEECRGPAGLC